MNGEKRNMYRLLIGRLQGNRQLGRPRCRCMDLVEIGSIGMDWVGLAQDREKWIAVVNVVMNFWIL
jgi:hypothetical protein